MENVTFTHVCSANANRIKQRNEMYPQNNTMTRIGEN